MKRYWLVFIFTIVLYGLIGCGKVPETLEQTSEQTPEQTHERVNEAPTDVMLSREGYELELIEREPDKEANVDFVVPTGEIAFGVIKGLSEKSFIMEYEDDETYEVAECRVSLNMRERDEIPDMRIDDKVVVFYDGTVEGDMPKEMNHVYAVYLQEEIPHPESLVEHKVVFLTEYISYAWGLQFYGHFMDTDGRVYRFEFEEHYYKDPPEADDRAAFFRSLEKIRKTEKPEKVVDASVVKQVCDIGSKIDAGADYYGMFSAEYDSGVHEIWFCNPETRENIMLDMDGEDIMRLSDENARKLVEMYDNAQIY